MLAALTALSLTFCECREFLHSPFVLHLTAEKQSPSWVKCLSALCNRKNKDYHLSACNTFPLVSLNPLFRILFMPAVKIQEFGGKRLKYILGFRTQRVTNGTLLMLFRCLSVCYKGCISTTGNTAIVNFICKTITPSTRNNKSKIKKNRGTT